MTKWATALDGDGPKPEIDADGAAAEKLGLTGTPSFVIVGTGAKSGYTIEGARDIRTFRKLIDRAQGDGGR